MKGNCAREMIFCWHFDYQSGRFDADMDIPRCLFMQNHNQVQ